MMASARVLRRRAEDEDEDRGRVQQLGMRSGEDAGAGDEGASPTMVYRCENCGAKNRIQAPEGFQLVDEEKHAEDETRPSRAGTHIVHGCEQCGDDTVVLPPAGRRLV